MASAKRNVKIELMSSAAQMDRGLNDARRKLKAFQREQKNAARDAERDEKRAQKDRERMVSRSSKVGRGLGSSAVAGLAAGAGLDLFGEVSKVASDVMDFNKELLRFQIDAQLSGSQAAAFAGQLSQVSSATGVSRNEIIHAAHAYQVLTGDAKGAVESVGLFAEVANASGSSMDDIAAAAASFKQNAKLDPSEFREAFDVLLTLGHKGSVELRDLSGEMSSLMPQFSRFGDKSHVEKVAELGAAMEEVRKGFASASEASTGMQAAMAQLGKSKVAARLEAAGVVVWKIDPKTGKHMERDIFDVLGDIKRKIPDEKILQDMIGGRQTASRAIYQMLDGYDEMLRLKNEALGSDQVAKDNQVYMESSVGRMNVAWAKTKNLIGEALSPEHVQAFVSALETAGSAFQSVFNLGKKIRGFLPGGDGHKSYKDDQIGDYAIHAQTDRNARFMLNQLVGHEVSDQELANRVAGAQRSRHDVDTYNASVDAIMGAQHGGENVTPESTQAALKAKWSGNLGSGLAGGTYLQNAGISDPADVSRQALAKIAATLEHMQNAANVARLAASIDKLAARLATAPSVKVGGDAVVRASDNANAHRLGHR